MRKATTLLFVLAAVVHLTAYAAIIPTFICPKISALKKNPNPAQSNWVAQTKEGGWKSYDMSFATTITQFLGAQWTGEEVGQVTCIYKSEQRFNLDGTQTIQPTIPVLLVYDKFTFQPKQGKWHPLKKNGQSVQGVFNCYSTSRHDCPFKPHMKPKTGDVLEQAESIKE